MKSTDAVAQLIDILKKARGYVECCCEEDRSDPASEVLAEIDAFFIAYAN